MKLICTYPHPEHPSRRVSCKIPLRSVSVTGTAVDSFARVTIAQVYENSTAHPLEAVFKMPIDEQSAVCGFEAVVDGKTVVGVVQEKSKAFETYDKAISEGHGAYLAEEERADVFTISVGNLPAGKSVEVRITYLTRLVSEGDDLRFTLPATIGERYTPSASSSAIIKDNKNDSSDAAVVAPPTSGSARYPIRVRLDLRMTAALRSVTSPSHPISFELGDQTGTGVVTLAREEPMDAEVVLVIATQDPHRPTACCEISSPTSSSEQQQQQQQCATAMVSLFPSFGTDALSASNGELYFLVDRSGSMSGSKMEQCKNALQLFLRSLPVGAKFNIVSFGSSHSEMFPGGCRALDDATLDEATRAVAAMSANMGGTEILAPLKAIISSKSSAIRHRGSKRNTASASVGSVGSRFFDGFFGSSRGKPSACEPESTGTTGSLTTTAATKQIVVLTDGQVSNTQAVLETVGAAAAAGTCRFFSLGIGNGASHELVAGIARRGRGVAEFVADGERMEAKVMRQLRRATKPALEGAKIEWLRGGTAITGVEMCPEELPPVFSGDRFTLFARFPPGGVVPDAARLTGRSIDGDVDTTLAIPEDAVRHGGDLLSVLAARETVRHLQETQGDKAQTRIVEIATKHGIASRYTSFVAVEKRDVPVDSANMDFVIVPQAAPRKRAEPVVSRSRMAAPRRHMMCGGPMPAPPMMNQPQHHYGFQQQQQQQQQQQSSFGGLGGGGCGGGPAPLMDCIASKSKKLSRPSMSKCDGGYNNAGVAMDFLAAPAAPSPPSGFASFSDDLFCAPPPPPPSAAAAAPAMYTQGVNADPFGQQLERCFAAKEMEADEAASDDEDNYNNNNNNNSAVAEQARPDSLLMLQRADGHWDFDGAFARATGVPVPSGDGWDAARLSFWATAIAVAKLRRDHGSTRDEWDMIACKAIAWLRAQIAGGVGGAGTTTPEDAVDRATRAVAASTKAVAIAGLVC